MYVNFTKYFIWLIEIIIYFLIHFVHVIYHIYFCICPMALLLLDLIPFDHSEYLLGSDIWFPSIFLRIFTVLHIRAIVLWCSFVVMLLVDLEIRAMLVSQNELH